MRSICSRLTYNMLQIPTYVNVILFLLILVLSFWIFQYKSTKIERFSGYNDNVAENMENDYSIQTACNEENPNPTLPIYLRWKNRCTNGYIDLNRDMPKPPLYMYPALQYHPVYDPFADFTEFNDQSS